MLMRLGTKGTDIWLGVHSPCRGAPHIGKSNWTPCKYRKAVLASSISKQSLLNILSSNRRAQNSKEPRTEEIAAGRPASARTKSTRREIRQEEVRKKGGNERGREPASRHHEA